MRDPNESADDNLDPASLECLKKTRSGVRLQAAPRSAPSLR